MEEIGGGYSGSRLFPVRRRLSGRGMGQAPPQAPPRGLARHLPTFFPLQNAKRSAIIATLCGRSSSVERQLPKLHRWVRLPSAAPKSRNNLDIVGCKSTVPRCCGFFIFKISEVQKKMPNRNFLNRMDLNSEFRYLGAHSSSGRPFSSQKGRPSTEKLYTKNRVPVCWYQKINRPGFFVFRHKRKRAPSPGKDGNSHGQHTAHLFCGT